MNIYEKIKTAIAQDYYQMEYPNDGQRFVAWYLRNIHHLESFVAKDCITDGANDKQIDAVYIDEQEETVYVIQGKFYEGKTISAEPLREMLSAALMLKDLRALQETANQKLRIKINDISEAYANGYDVCLELITTSELSEQAKVFAEEIANQFKGEGGVNIRLDIVSNCALAARYDESLNHSRPYLDHVFNLEGDKYKKLVIGGTNVVVAAMPLKECANIEGIQEGTLFRKNVRQSLGMRNRVNKGIADTIRHDPKNLFFLHNGITAICSQMSIQGNQLLVKDLNVVNGCQSLSTIHAYSEAAKAAVESYVLFRFYEIDDSLRADKISTSTNSQSAVKARDLRSNDKAVLQMKKLYEEKYPGGCFLTKRGEVAPSASDKEHTVDLSLLGKLLMAWHSQRPTISYSETKIFDKYFDTLFKRGDVYNPEDVQALNELFKEVLRNWCDENPLNFNDALLPMKSYATYHHLYAIAVFFRVISNVSRDCVVPKPSLAYKVLCDGGQLAYVVKLAGKALNTAFIRASKEASESGRIFSPQNWTKGKSSLKDISVAIESNIDMMELMDADEGLDRLKSLKAKLSLPKEAFTPRWTAD